MTSDHALENELLEKDLGLRLFYSSDIYYEGELAEFIARPKNSDEIIKIINIANENNLKICVRGGGASYTGGYVPTKPKTILIDIGSLNKILEINIEDGWINVESGVNWEQIDDALKPYKYRACVRGPLSGRCATVGGGISNNGAFWGAKNGTFINSFLSAQICTMDGKMIEIGNDKIFSYGPDLRSLFSGDCGSFGVKLSAKIAIEPIPDETGYGSYTFASPKKFLRALSSLARIDGVKEIFGFDPVLANIRAQRDSFKNDIVALAKTINSQKDIIKSIKTGVKIASTGRSVIATGDYVLNFIVEGNCDAAVSHTLLKAKQLLIGLGGKEIEPNIPKVLKANPFSNLNAVLGPNGERWSPIHGIVANSRANELHKEVLEILEVNSNSMNKLGVKVGILYVGLNRHSLIIEPVLYWPGEARLIHNHFVEKSIRNTQTKFEHDQSISVYVESLRNQILSKFLEFDAANFQIGRTYDFASNIGETKLNILRKIKSLLDKNHIMSGGIRSITE